MSNTTIKVPRIPKGRGFRGPEWYGCCGTGAAPCIRRSKFTGKYVVGTEMSTDMALSDRRILAGLITCGAMVPIGIGCWVAVLCDVETPFIPGTPPAAEAPMDPTNG